MKGHKRRYVGTLTALPAKAWGLGGKIDNENTAESVQIGWDMNIKTFNGHPFCFGLMFLRSKQGVKQWILSS